MMNKHGYLRMPDQFANVLIFVSDDDLWHIDLGQECLPRRLTQTRAMCLDPLISPDGQYVAYRSNERGLAEIFLQSLGSHDVKKVTALRNPLLIRWVDDKTLLIGSSHENFTIREKHLYYLDIETQELTPLNLGPADFYEQHKETGVEFLSRNMRDPARWKRYRGGTAGTLWYKSKTMNDYRQLFTNLKGNFASPRIFNNRFYFLSDHEGQANLYSSPITSRGVGRPRKETDESDYYVRNYSFNAEGRLIYSVAGKLKIINPGEKRATELAITLSASSFQSRKEIRRQAAQVQDFSLSKNGREIALNSRGRIHWLRPWSLPPIQLGEDNGRYKHPCFMDDSILAAWVDPEKEEVLQKIDLKTKKWQTILPRMNWGKMISIIPSPDNKNLLISTNRNELYLVDVNRPSAKLLCRNEFGFNMGQCFSPKGRYIVWSTTNKYRQNYFKIYDTKTNREKTLLSPMVKDFSPSFSPDGKVLFFLGVRDFRPVYSETHFDLGLPLATRPFALILDPKVESLHRWHLDLENDDEEKDNDKEKKKITKKKANTKKNTETDFEIVYEGLESRLEAFDLPVGGYLYLQAAKDKIFYLKESFSPLDPYKGWDNDSSTDLLSYCFKDKKEETFQSNCSDFSLSADGKMITLVSDCSLRLVATDSKPSDGDELNKKDGWIDLHMIPSQYDPKKEWRQIYREAWVLQREHFWSEDMCKVDWQNVYQKYLPVLDLVQTRSELSDLLWEMQGELGTSHCYEFGGDYTKLGNYFPTGQLGGIFSWNPNKKCIEVEEIFDGDSWIEMARSPLAGAGVNMKSGDEIHAIDGRQIEQASDLDYYLEDKAGNDVLLTIKRSGEREKADVVVTPLYQQNEVLYRQWIKKNRAYVHEKTGGKIGYVHVPDMGVRGYSEFYRQFLQEVNRDGLIVDVRYNGGGHVSQHLLKILAQKVLGYDATRYMDIERYPSYAIPGPIVALTNEHAGSDGDIFSHSFKLMGLGKLIGKRTWGGVVGIWPRQFLNDGTVTTQPEFSFWFNDVGYKVENYGTDPDIEVENTPLSYQKGLDLQLDRGIEEAMKDLRRKPVKIPDALKKDRPDLRF